MTAVQLRPGAREPVGAAGAAPPGHGWPAHEARIVGRALIALPLLLLTGLLVIAAARVLAGSWEQARTVMLAGLESGVPLAAGIGAAVAVTAERSIELQLSLRTPYRSTVLRRVSLPAASAVAAGLLGALPLAAVGALPSAGAAVAYTLLWAAPLAWFLGGGAVLGLLAGRTAGTGLLIALWWAHHVLPIVFRARTGLRPLWLFLTTHQGLTVEWPLNRAALLVQAVLLALVARWLLSRPDRLLHGDAA